MHKVDYHPVGTQELVACCGRKLPLDYGIGNDRHVTCSGCKAEMTRRKALPVQDQEGGETVESEADRLFSGR